MPPFTKVLVFHEMPIFRYCRHEELALIARQPHRAEQRRRARFFTQLTPGDSSAADASRAILEWA